MTNFISLRVHAVCRTRRGFPSIPDELQPMLWAYIGGIVKRIGLKLYQVGGERDHMHLFFGLPETLTISSVMRSIQEKSSVWIRQHPGLAKFQWQESYAAFSVSASQTDRTMAYIRGQKQHHQKRDFNTELASIARAHGLIAGPRGTWVEE